MTFNFFNFNSTLIYVLIDIYYNYQFIALYLGMIISTIASIILVSSSNSAKTIGKWVVAGGAFEAGSQIVSAGIDAVKEGINSITDGNTSAGSNSGGNSTGNTGANSGGSSSGSNNASNNTGSSSSTSSSVGGNTGGSSGGK